MTLGHHKLREQRDMEGGSRITVPMLPHNASEMLRHRLLEQWGLSRLSVIPYSSATKLVYLCWPHTKCLG